MAFKWSKLAALVSASALIATGLTAATTTAAQAATPEAYISLVSPALDATTLSEADANQQLADQWVQNGWFGSGLKYQRSWAPTGSTITLVYKVVGADGKPLANTDVMLRIGKGYSGSNAIVSVDDQKTNGVDRPPLDQARVTHKTDADGLVTFVMKSLDDPKMGEKKPAKWTDPADNDPLSGLFVQVLPQVNGEKPDHSTINEFHFYTESSTPVTPPVVQKAPTIRLVSPALDDKNSVHRIDLETLFSVTNNWYAKGISVRQAYLPVGSTTTLTYKVLGDDGMPLANAKVKLHVNKAYSKSNANLTDGTTATDTKLPEDADQAIWIGTTNADGLVSFNMTNTDEKGIDKPSSFTNAVPTEGSLFSQIYPEVSGQAVDKADMVEFHFYGSKTAPVAKDVTIAAKASKKKVKGKIVYTVSVTVNNASGMRADISVSGLKTVTKAIAEDTAVFKFTVKKGAKKVTVTIDGKAYLTSVNVK